MKIEVRFYMDIPIDGVSDSQVNEWLSYVLGKVGHMHNDNPLVDMELNANYIATSFIKR